MSDPVISADAKSAASVLLNDPALSRRVDEANARVIEAVSTADPLLERVLPAREVIPDLAPDTVLHSGPPIDWEGMCPLLQGAICAALIYEGRARSMDEARKLVSSADVKLESCHDRDGVAPLAGVVTPSMPVILVIERCSGARSFAPLNEGLGKVLRYGAHSAEVFQRLAWMRSELAPVLDDAATRAGGIPLFPIMEQALHMGDECHNRHKAGTALLLKALTPHLLGHEDERIRRVFDFIGRTDVFFLNLAMAAVKATLSSVGEVPFSSIVTVMSQNGTQFGIKAAGTGNRWFECGAPLIEGKYLPGYGSADASPGIGDSLITEVLGFGGFALAAAPALVQYIGGSPERATSLNVEMYSITATESRRFTIPGLGFRGVPLGIDLRRVVTTGISPVANAGIAHRSPGVGQIGAGYLRAPLECFDAAAIGLYRACTESVAAASEGA